MITARTLQFDAECSQIAADAETAAREGHDGDALRLQQEWAAKVQSSVDEMLRTKGFELLLAGMRMVVSQALQRIAAGEQPEFNAGRISAIEDIRARLREWTTTVEFLDAYDEGLTHE